MTEPQADAHRAAWVFSPLETAAMARWMAFPIRDMA